MQYTTEELKTILDLHQKWLYNKEEGKYADLRFADLHNANLHNANLHNADLRGADLHNANLSDANLYNADLRGANMHNADLSGADLSGADLRGANLRGADLHNANLSGAKNISPLVAARVSIVPEIGEFIGYKKAYVKGNVFDGIAVIVTLKIAEDAKRSNATGRKCRCSKARVLSITDRNGNTLTSACSLHDKNFIYNVGETVEVADFDENRWEECASGIHFFITRAEAEDY